MNTKTLPLALLMLALAIPGRVPAIGPTGDVNLDGEVALPDLLWGEQWVLGTRILEGPEQYQGDVAPLVNGIPDPNGVLDVADVLVLLQMILYGIDFSYPGNQFNIGDSIGEGEAATEDSGIGDANHDIVWSTGFNGSDGVNSFNERFEVADAAGYYENNALRDPDFNKAVSGAVMADFAAQAQLVVNEAGALLDGAGMVTVFLGNNDVCAPSLAEMTDTVLFEDQFRTGLDVLAGNEATRLSQVHVSGIPAIYWLWNAKRSNFICRLIWLGVPCQNLLADGADDCANATSRLDPDNDYPGDGENCARRKQFHRIIRDDYNTILSDVTGEYRENGLLPNARYVDIYDVQFGSIHVNNNDCFHPSVAGHTLLADKSWCRTHWGTDDALCSN